MRPGRCSRDEVPPRWCSGSPRGRLPALLQLIYLGSRRGSCGARRTSPTCCSHGAQIVALWRRRSSGRATRVTGARGPMRALLLDARTRLICPAFSGALPRHSTQQGAGASDVSSDGAPRGRGAATGRRAAAHDDVPAPAAAPGAGGPDVAPAPAARVASQSAEAALTPSAPPPGQSRVCHDLERLGCKHVHRRRSKIIRSRPYAACRRSLAGRRECPADPDGGAGSPRPRGRGQRRRPPLPCLAGLASFVCGAHLGNGAVCPQW